MGVLAMAGADKNVKSVKVEILPAQKKPKPRSVLYPFSGGKLAKTQGYYGSTPERSPALKLLKLSPGGGMTLSGGTGIVKISAADVAASLAMRSPRALGEAAQKLSHEAYYLALAKYLDDPGAISMAIQCAYLGAIELAIANGWKTVRGKEIFRNSALLALSRHIKTDGQMYCPKCKGATVKKSGDPCKACDGTGKKALSYRALGRLIGTDHKNFTKVWLPRIDMISDMITRWDHEVLGHLYDQFSMK